MSTNLFSAILLLQEKASHSSNIYQQELLDRAIDDLLNNPHREGSPEQLVNCAIGNAGKVLRGRKKFWVYNPEAFDYVPTDDSYDHLVIYIEDFIERSNISAMDKEVLLHLSHGLEAEEMAPVFTTSVKNARVRISRARKEALKRWEGIA